MKRIAWGVLLLLVCLFFPSASEARQRAFGFCEQGNVTAVVSGLSATPKVMGSYPLCTVTVYLTGTTNLATIYSDNAGTLLANPFTASATGFWFFYADDGRYDVKLSGTVPVPWTIGDVLLDDASAPTGNLTPTSVNTPQLTTGPVQIGSVWYPGTASGTCTAPTLPPGATAVLSGGSIADGTYYFKITYVNKNGETTASPTTTVIVLGGGGAARINTVPTDTNWATGCYGYHTYASTDNVTFHLQTPTPVASDFMTDATTHYVTMGSFGARLNSLAFAGAVPPVVNTAVIDPLQVGLNATRNANGTPAGVLFVPAFTLTQTVWALTTPLIMQSGDRVMGAATYLLVNGQSRIYMTVADPKLAAVMWFGGDGTLDNVGIQNTGHVLMLLGGVGYQSGHRGTWMDNLELRTTDLTNTYAPFVTKGVIYNLHIGRHHSLGSIANVLIQNGAGGNWTVGPARWDAGLSFIKTVPGWTDPDNGAHDAGFAFGLANLHFQDILTEGGSGILFDCVGLGMEFNNFTTADTVIAGGTDSLAKFGTDVTYGGSGGPIVLRDSHFGNSANARVGTNLVVSGASLTAYGKSSFGFGSSTGNQQTVDFNNIVGLQIEDFAGAIGSIDPAASATTPHVINMPANTLLRAVLGDAGGGANVVSTNAIMGRLYLLYKSGSAGDFTNRASILNTGSNIEIRKNDDSTYILQTPFNSDGNFNFRNNVRIQATAGNAATLFIGPSASTAAGGSIAGIAGFNIVAKGVADTTLLAHYQVGGVDYTKICSTNCGGVMLENARIVYGRNFLNNGNVPLFAVNASDLFEIQGATVPVANDTAFGTQAGPKRWQLFATSLNMSGLLNNYNSISTVGNGVPAEYAAVNLTAQTAAIGTTTLYAVPATGAGQYRISWNAKVTTADGVSSTLGALTIVYTDPDGVVQTITAPASVAAGTIATSSTGNTTTTVLLGLPLLLNCKLSTNITYAFAYVSNTPGSMAYNLHIVAEKM